MSHYEINVTRLVNGRSVHWFATHERSIPSLEKAKELVSAFRSLPDAHEVTCSYYETNGTQVQI